LTGRKKHNHKKKKYFLGFNNLVFLGRYFLGWQSSDSSENKFQFPERGGGHAFVEGPF